MMSNNDSTYPASLTPFKQKRLSEKLVIIINGKGGVGKDTVCDVAAKFFRVKVVSSITPIKEVAAHCGWTGEKDNKSRKFLADLKALLIDYNGLPNNYLEKEYNDFMLSGNCGDNRGNISSNKCSNTCNENDLLFVHIREGSQIDDFKKRIPSKCITLIIRSPVIDSTNVVYGNVSDDDVEDYDYDYSFTNGSSLEALDRDFIEFLNELFATEGISVTEGINT